MKKSDVSVKKLGENIRARRVQLGLTQEQLRDLIGYGSRTTITKIENGHIDLTQSKLALFAEALKTTPAELMHGVAEAMIQDDPFLGLSITLDKIAAQYQVPFDGLPEEVQSKIVSAAVSAVLQYYNHRVK